MLGTIFWQLRKAFLDRYPRRSSFFLLSQIARQVTRVTSVYHFINRIFTGPHPTCHSHQSYRHHCSRTGEYGAIVVVFERQPLILVKQNDGEKLVGQCEISHPVPSEGPSLVLDAQAPDEEPLESVVDDGLGEFASPRQNILFESASKGSYEALPSRIQRLWCSLYFSLNLLTDVEMRTGLYYINGYGMEIHPSPNKEFLSNLSTRNVLVYSCGSLWTRSVYVHPLHILMAHVMYSIIPCLALKGVAEKIARSHSLRAKVLLCE